MRNPLVDEDAAFRLVLGTIAYFVPIVLAAWIATWLGVIVFVIASGVVVAVLWRGRGVRVAPEPEPARAAVADTFRILVVANAGLGAPGLFEEVRRLSTGVTEDVLVICPLTPAAAVAEVDAALLRLESVLGKLEAAGVNVRGELVRADPVAAFEEALRSFGPDEVVVAAGGDPADGIDERLVESVRARSPGQVTVVADTE